jgi:hydroxylaminobenzene mutase
MKENVSRRLLFAGFLLLLLGLLTGFTLPLLVNPRMGLASHMQGITNGLLLVALGLCWGCLVLSSRAAWLTGWLALYGTYANWLATLLAAIWGTGTMMPLAAAGFTAAPWKEQLVSLLLMSLSLAMVLALLLVIWGLRPGVQQRHEEGA